MTDFGSMFDNAKSEADRKRAEERATLENLKAEKKARFDESMKPIVTIVDPAFALAMRQLQPKGIKLSNDIGDKMLYANNERKPAKNYQLRLGHNIPGSVYHFEVFGTSHIICTVYPYDHRQETRGQQVLRCPLNELTTEKVDQIIGMAVGEVARSQ